MKKSIENYVNNETPLNESIIGGLVLFFGIDAILSALYALLTFFARILLSQQVIEQLERGGYTTYDKNLSQKIISITKDSNVKVHILDIDEKANAFNLGTADIYLTNDLFNLLTEDEIVAVCLHEYGHFYYGHFNERNIKFSLADFIACFAMIPFGIITYGIGFIFWPIIMPILTKMGYTAVDRKSYKLQEYAADSYAKEKGYGKQLASALIKFEQYVYSEFREQICKKKRYSEIECASHYEKLISKHSKKADAHPTTKNRVEELQLKFMIKKIAEKAFSGKNGFRNVFRSLNATINKLEGMKNET